MKVTCTDQKWHKLYKEAAEIQVHLKTVSIFQAFLRNLV